MFCPLFLVLYVRGLLSAHYVWRKKYIVLPHRLGYINVLWNITHIYRTYIHILCLLAVWHYTIIVARCDGIHGVLYTRGGKWHPRRSRGCHLPPRVYKTHGPQSQRATIVLLYLCNIVIPFLEVLLSSSNIIKTEQCIVQSWFNKQTNSSNKKQFFTCWSNPRVFRTALEIDQRRERSRWCTSVYITFHVTRRAVHYA